jgi:hypothetical protein
LHRDSDEAFEGKEDIFSVKIRPLRSLLVPVERIHADEERLLETIPPGSQEAIVSCLSLHWVNDLPGTCLQSQGKSTDRFSQASSFKSVKHSNLMDSS